MRIFRGLENIHSVIDRHEAEWRREQGEEPERPDALSLEEAVRRRIAARPETGSGKFSADRFLGVKHDSPKPEAPIPEPEPAPNEPDSSAIPETETTPATHEPESDIAPELDAIPDVIEVIPPKEGRHSWLYNEVLKAVNDAAQDRKNTKIISVFVPVVQDGGEFEDLPADGVLNISPVNKNATRPAPEIEATEIIRHKDGKHSRLYDEVMRAITDAAENGKFSKVVAVFVPVVQSKSEFEDMPFDEAMTASPVSEDFANVESFSPEAPVNESDAQESESPASVETLPKISESPEAETLAVMSEALPEIAESLEVADMAEIESPATELEIPEEMPALESPEEFDLLPETKPDAELAKAFREMEEKLDEDIQLEEQQNDSEIESEIAPEEPTIESDIEPITAQEPESPLTDDEPEMIIPPEESHDEPEIIAPENDDDEFSDLGIPMDTGEAMRFEDIDAEEQPAEILLPGELDDDEVFDEPTFDESFTEVHKPDDDTEPEIIIEESDAFPDDDEDDEIEILPDPVKL